MSARRTSALAAARALAAAALLALPDIGRGQGAPPSDWPARVSAAARAELAAVADSARAAGAPTRPLYDKAAEGVLKRADDARIVVAVRRLAAELVAARGALGDAAPESEVSLAASALRAGVSRDALRQLARARAAGRGTEPRGADPRGPDGSLIVPLTALTELVAGGVPAEVAARAVAGFVARGGPASELEAVLRPLAQTGAAPGADPQAAAARARALLDALDGRSGGTTRRPPTP